MSFFFAALLVLILVESRGRGVPLFVRWILKGIRGGVRVGVLALLTSNAVLVCARNVGVRCWITSGTGRIM
jgi:hypothetical protein